VVVDGAGVVVDWIGVGLVGVAVVGGGTGVLVTGWVRVTGALVVGAVVGCEVLVTVTGFFRVTGVGVGGVGAAGARVAGWRAARAVR
jgi:hypothetical protein